MKIKDAAGNWRNLLSGGTGSTSKTTSAMDPELIQATWGTQVQVGMEPVIIPSPDFIDRSGAYYTQADLRINYMPASTTTGNTDYLEIVPFDIQARATDGSYASLSEGQLRSLRQPIMVSPELESAGYCDALSVPSLSVDNNTKRIVVESLKTAIASEVKPVRFSSLSTSLSDAEFDTLRTNFLQTLNNRLSTELSVTLDAAEVIAITSLTPEQIAAITYTRDVTDPSDGSVSSVADGGSCFVSAPIRDIGRDSNSHQSPYRFYNDREGREMRLLQTNMESLTIWNQDGVYVDFTAASVSDTNGGVGFSSQDLLFERVAPDAAAPADSFQRLGLASSDTSSGGLVFHASVDESVYTAAGGIDSPYGFVVAEGQQLMGLEATSNNLESTGMTFVSDQAVYLQGDYNNVNKQPAAILADSLNVLSNSCQNQDGMVNKKSNKNCNPDINNEDSKSDAATTTINSAFLANTDITNSSEAPGYNGGLENYPRFAEKWSGKTLSYRGSFVSLGTPRHVSGKWGSQKYNPPGRDWEFDQDFNDPDNLPPLSPRFVHVRQDSFERYLD